MAAISRTFSNALSSTKTFEFQMEINWNMFLRVWLTISQHCLVSIMAWRHSLSEPMMVWFTETYMRHSASMSLWHVHTNLTFLKNQSGKWCSASAENGVTKGCNLRPIYKRFAIWWQLEYLFSLYLFNHIGEVHHFLLSHRVPWIQRCNEIGK